MIRVTVCKNCTLVVCGQAGFNYGQGVWFTKVLYTIVIIFGG